MQHSSIKLATLLGVASSTHLQSESQQASSSQGWLASAHRSTRVLEAGNCASSWFSSHRSSEMAHPSNPQVDLTATLPYETLRDILHHVTFIPHEWDVGATSIFRGLFCSWEEIQIKAWKKLLPCRIAISCVSRRWREIAVEILYGTFHDGYPKSLPLFASLLSAYPYYGTLVRRLTIRLVNESDKSVMHSQILRRCPNLLILSIIPSQKYLALSKPILSDPSTLTTSLKQLDAIVYCLSASSVLVLLAHLPRLEILFLYGIKSYSRATDTKIVLPNLRILRLEFHTDDPSSISSFTLSLELPLVSAMCIKVPSECSIPSFPMELSERLEYLQFSIYRNDIDAWEARDFRNLRFLRLPWRYLDLDNFRSRLPMNQIIGLTCDFHLFEPKSVLMKESFGFLLDPAMMPKLRSLALIPGAEPCTLNTVLARILGSLWLSAYYEALAASFGQRGVDLWFDCSDLWSTNERILVRDMICMHRKK